MIKVLSVVAMLMVARAYPQTDLRPLVEVQSSFEQTSAEHGRRTAFLAFLGDDSIVFEPGPRDGKEYWRSRQTDEASVLVRSLTYSDISANGLLGYTTGNWRIYQKDKSEGLAKFGQYVTIWEKRPDGRFRAGVNIEISHPKLSFADTDRPIRSNQSRDINKRGWSPADASMNFLRASMTSEHLGGAYKRFAGDDVRLLRDGEPPIIGKKRVIEAMNEYVSIVFPSKVALFQSADMAYTWNPCSFDNSNEGQVKGNCLHIWKLRKKKWWIVLGVFSPIPNLTRPVLTTKPSR
ncbi:MAG: hypothetical protein ABI646_08020 [Acidobacteriota bacterium]